MVFTKIQDQVLNLHKTKDLVIIAICGAADTGKSTMAKLLNDQLNQLDLKSDYICTDSFLIERSERIKQEISGYHPLAFKQENLLEIVKNILLKKEIEYFPYDNKTGKTSPVCRVIPVIDFLIVEGIHAFNNSISDFIDLKIFIDSDDNTLHQLRYNANILKRGFKEPEASQHISKEMAEYHLYVRPCMQQADMIIGTDRQYNYSLLDR